MLWKVVPAWTIYVLIASVQLVLGIVFTLIDKVYPVTAVYMEPVIVIGQIAFTLEAGIRYLQSTYSQSEESPENRLLLWLIPIIPTAVGLPIEMGFVQEAVRAWSRDPGDALRLLYLVHVFLSGTLFIGLLGTRLMVRFQGRTANPLLRFHLDLLMVYVASYAIGYYAKLSAAGSWDIVVLGVFFLAIPLGCYLVWAWRMKGATPEAFKTRRPERQDAPAKTRPTEPQNPSRLLGTQRT